MPEEINVYGKSIYVGKEDVEIDTTAKHITINTGTDTLIEIVKMFGPLIANTIRVRLDYDSVSWIVERKRIVYTVKSITKDKKGLTIYDNDITSEWDEVARIDANVHDDLPWEEREDGEK